MVVGLIVVGAVDYGLVVRGASVFMFFTVVAGHLVLFFRALRRLLPRVILP
jgi:hypothetical protein